MTSPTRPGQSTVLPAAPPLPAVPPLTGGLPAAAPARSAPDRTFDAAGLAALLGCAPAELPGACARTLATARLRHRVLTGPAREAQLLAALRRTEADDLPPSGPHRAADWERGWNENLRALESAPFALEALIPRYNRHSVLRLCGDYVEVDHPHFEYHVYTALRQSWFARWFADCEAVTEFGCGTGTSLWLLAQLFPHLRLCGCDWAPASQRILARLAERRGRPIEGRRFDMFRPDATLRIGRDTGVLTSAAMEQLGADHGAFVDYLLAQDPAVCVHIEPLYELYDEGQLFDHVARRYHRQRNYLTGFVPRLQELAAAGRIELLALRRTGFGSFFHEGYGFVAWRPARRGAESGR